MTAVFQGIDAAPPGSREPAEETPHKLDDVMMAMDVVDTIRHREELVRRELDDEAREADLIARLREIYRQQGIAVTDAALAEGVRALRERRFSYERKAPSWRRTAFELWAKRRRNGRIAVAIGGLAIGLWGYNYVTSTRPAELAAENIRIEITETLPKAIKQTHADIAAVSREPAAKERADVLLADGERAMRDRDRTALARVAGELRSLHDELIAEYTLTIVSRPGDTTGIWRRPPRGSSQLNYYLIVEAIAPAGGKLTLPVRNEETGETTQTDKFAVRVPQATYEAVRTDKQDDGIVQRNRFGTKRRGTRVIEYLMPFEGGTITKW